MRKNFLTLSSLLLGTLIIAGPAINANGVATQLPSYKINSTISIPELKLAKNTYVSDYKNVDINGDKVQDNVILTGTKMNVEDVYFENLNVIVQDGTTKKYKKLSLGENSGGYNPTMFLGDFNSDKSADIFVEMPTGGSGHFMNYSIVNFKGNNPSILWDSEKFENEIDLTGKFQDNFIVSLTSKKLNKEFKIDLSSNKDKYIEANIYDKDGKIKENIEPWMGGFYEIIPTDVDKNGVYELNVTQRIVGTCNADTIGYLQTEWKWDGKDITLNNDKVSLKHIFTEVVADFNGDGTKEYFSLTGVSDLNLSSMYSENININVYDEKTNKFIEIPVSKTNSGYTPKVLVGDFNNDKADELQVLR